MKVGDLVKNIHALYSATLGTIVESHAVDGECYQYRVAWHDTSFDPAWMRPEWLEKL